MKLNPFKLLNIPENSSEDQIKKAFKKIIFDVHPDIPNNENKTDAAALIIDAYKKALDYRSSPKSNNTKKENKSIDYSLKLFGFPYQAIYTDDEFFLYLNIILKNSRDFFYDLNKLDDFLSFLEILIRDINKSKNIDNSEYFVFIFLLFTFIITSRQKSLTDFTMEEYSLEKMRSFFISQAESILESKNYIDFRLKISSFSKNIVQESCFNIKKLNSSSLKEEAALTTLLSLLLAESDFYEKWFLTLPGEKK